MASRYKKHLVILTVSYFIAIVIVVREFLVHALSRRGYGMTMLVLMAVMFVAYWVIFRKIAKEAPPVSQTGPVVLDTKARRRIMIQIWLFRILIALLAIGLISGLRDITSQTLIPSLIGIVTNLLMISVFVAAMVRLQRKLK